MTVHLLLKLHFQLVFLAVQWDAIFRSNNGSKFSVHTNMNPNIGLLRLFPGITAETVSHWALGHVVLIFISIEAWWPAGFRIKWSGHKPWLAWGHHVVFLGKTLNSHSASFQECKWVPAINCWGMGQNVGRE